MDHREVAGAPPSRSAGGEFLLSLLQKSQPSIDPAVGPSPQQSPLFPPNFFLQGFPQPQPQSHPNQMRFGNLPSELLLNLASSSSSTDNNNNININNRDLDLAMRNLDVSNKNSGLGFSGNSHSSSYNRRGGSGDYYHDNLELDRRNNTQLLNRSTSTDNNRDLDLDFDVGLMRNLDGANKNSEFGFSKNNQYNGRGKNGDYHDNMEFDRRNGAGLGRQDHGVIHHHYKSMQSGVIGRQEHGANHHHHRSIQNGEFSRQVGNKSLNDDNREMDGRGDSRLRQDHGVIHHSSMQDGQFSRQERAVGHRFSNDGELGRQERVVGHRSSNDSGFSRQERGGGVDRMLQVTPRPPPGFPSNPRGGRNVGDKNGDFEDAKRNSGHIDQFDSRGGRNWDDGNRRRNFEQNVGGKNGGFGEFSSRINTPIDEFNSHGDAMRRRGINDQFDIPGPPTGSKLHSVRASGIEGSLMKLHAETEEIANEQKQVETCNDKDVDDHNDNSNKKKAQNSRDKYARSDSRGNWLLSQKMRNLKKQMICRPDIDMLNAPLHKLYDTLVPTEEEKAKQKQLMTQLEGLVCKEWPDAKLYLYGSCANSFGVSKSDIDVCLAIDDAEINKSEFLMRLAEILESDNLQNVQALTRARVPIVKLMDPVSGISCDICINNVLAVVNTKLLRDYAQIDGRLRHLAFIVKHWAKSRGVNATYQGTLSSYAYVVMCIHFLQQRRPAILPCLQGLEPTYSVTVDDVKCTYFDRIENLLGFGSHNKESIAQLVWGFFIYWAYCHDYANNAISIRTGTIISKQSKDWTTRVGNDRHLICIEDPFEISHDLGRVVDKYSIKVLREEFERAAHIMQYDPNPCVNLFEPYVPEGRLLNP